MYLARESQMVSVSFEMLGFSLCLAFTKAGQSSHNRGLENNTWTYGVPQRGCCPLGDPDTRLILLKNCFVLIRYESTYQKLLKLWLYS